MALISANSNGGSLHFRDCMEAREEDLAYTLCLENSLFYQTTPRPRYHTYYDYTQIVNYYGLGKFTRALEITSISYINSTGRLFFHLSSHVNSSTTARCKMWVNALESGQIDLDDENFSL